MTKKEKLKKLRDTLSKLIFKEEDEEEYFEEEYLDEDDIELEELKLDQEVYNNVKDLSGFQALTTELVYLYAKFDKILDGTLLKTDMETTLIASALVMAGLSFHIFTEFLEDRASDKISKLELKIKTKKIEDFDE